MDGGQLKHTSGRSISHTRPVILGGDANCAGGITSIQITYSALYKLMPQLSSGVFMLICGDVFPDGRHSGEFFVEKVVDNINDLRARSFGLRSEIFTA